MARYTRPISTSCRTVRQLVEQSPDKKYIIVCDGLNTHKSESLVRLTAELCHLPDKLGTKGKEGILKSMKCRETFLMDASHRILFVYTPKHGSWVNQIEIWFGIIAKKLLKKINYISTPKMAQSILNFIRQYNLTVKAFNWKYTG